jgi:F0F1-type ATP synthase assembly protein I
VKPSSDSGPRRAQKGHIQESLGDASPYLGLGMQLGLTMAFFVGVGYFLDRWLDTSPWLLTAGAVVGMVALFVQIFRVVADLNKQTTARAKKKPKE